MKIIEFKNTASRKLYNSYIKRISKVSSSLPKDDRQDILMEFNSHIYEASKTTTSISELETLVNVLDQLGEPEEVLKPLIADKKLMQATKTFNPLHLLKALALNIGNGISYAVFSILYLSLFIFIVAIIMKINNPSEVGLFFVNGSIETLGTYKGIPGDEIIEILGNWFIPVMAICLVLFFVLITLLLRFNQKFKN